MGRERIATSAHPYANSNRSTSSARWRQTAAMFSRMALSSRVNACCANSSHSAACALYCLARTSTGDNTLIRWFPVICASAFMTSERNATIVVPGTWDAEKKIHHDVVKFPLPNALPIYRPQRKFSVLRQMTSPIRCCQLKSGQGRRFNPTSRRAAPEPRALLRPADFPAPQTGPPPACADNRRAAWRGPQARHRRSSP